MRYVLGMWNVYDMPQHQVSSPPRARVGVGVVSEARVTADGVCWAIEAERMQSGVGRGWICDAFLGGSSPGSEEPQGAAKASGYSKGRQHCVCVSAEGGGGGEGGCSGKTHVRQTAFTVTYATACRRSRRE
ncbi:hypothetical protein MATL_G00142470 [Megalops atlanticus]|uniref:Uncharacterized protein n=1 Tax=Megalops atlanticus TaxID=7932 RepID=A0A9D3PY89_MEGAT|nr:hypothetical protein MATL_G00142470 [Megalops atlanticus]